MEPVYSAALFFFSSRRRHTRCGRDWSSDVCSSDLHMGIITMAHHMGLVVVAEGIETVEQQQELARRGADLLQGYLFSRPLPLAGLAALPERLPAATSSPSDRKSTRLNSSHVRISYAVFCLK